GIEKALGLLDVEVVRRVEDVHDERAGDFGVLNPQIEVAERYGMRERRRRNADEQAQTEERALHARNGNVKPWRSRPARCTCSTICRSTINVRSWRNAARSST